MPREEPIGLESEGGFDRADQRRDYKHGEGTIRSPARKFGLHRRMVRQALANTLALERKRPERAWPRLGPVKHFIDAILEAAGRRRGSSDIPRTESGNGSGRRSRGVRSASPACGAMP